MARMSTRIAALAGMDTLTPFWLKPWLTRTPSNRTWGRRGAVTGEGQGPGLPQAGSPLPARLPARTRPSSCPLAAGSVVRMTSEDA